MLHYMSHNFREYQHDLKRFFFFFFTIICKKNNNIWIQQSAFEYNQQKVNMMHFLL